MTDHRTPRPASARRALVTGACTLAALLAPAGVAQAAIFTVTRQDDPAPDACAAADCSLREAIRAANAAAGDDVVDVPAGRYELAQASGDDTAAAGDLDLLANGTITIAGAGAAATVVDGNDLDKVFDIPAGPSGPDPITGATAEINDLTVVDGASSFGGAAIFNDDGRLAVNRAVLDSNQASFGGAGIFGNGDAVITVRDTTFSNNTATFGGGGIFNNNDTDTTVTGSTFSDNHAGFGGGAIFDNNDSRLTVADSVFLRNSANFGGGGLWHQNDTVGTVTRSAFRENTSPGLGGGGIFNQNDAQLTVRDSELAGNVAESTADGGGLFAQNGSTTELVNTTVSGNRAGETGGGVHLSNQAALSALNVTIASNEAHTASGSSSGADGGGIYDRRSSPPAPATFKNTIVAGNSTDGTADNCAGDPSTVFSSGGNNLENTNTCGFGAAGDQSGTDPLLEALGDNGGTTRTHALPQASPAVDAADTAAAPPADQRGVARPQGPAADIGAFERAVPPPAPAQQNEQPGVTASGVPRACTSRRKIRLRVNVTGLTRESVQRVDVFLDGRRIRRSTQASFTVTVRVARLSRRRTHRIRIVATDESGDQATRTRRFRRCARRAQVGPRFTG